MWTVETGIATSKNVACEGELFIDQVGSTALKKDWWQDSVSRTCFRVYIISAYNSLP